MEASSNEPSRDTQPPRKRLRTISDFDIVGNSNSKQATCLSAGSNGSGSTTYTGGCNEVGWTNQIEISSLPESATIVRSTIQRSLLSYLSQFIGVVTELSAAKLQQESAQRRYSEKKKEHDRAQPLFRDFRATAEHRQTALSSAKNDLEDKSERVKKEQKTAEDIALGLSTEIAKVYDHHKSDPAIELLKQELRQKDAMIAELNGAIGRLHQQQKMDHELLLALQSKDIVTKGDMNHAISQHCSKIPEVLELKSEVDSIRHESLSGNDRLKDVEIALTALEGTIESDSIELRRHMQQICTENESFRAAVREIGSMRSEFKDQKDEIGKFRMAREGHNSPPASLKEITILEDRLCCLERSLGTQLEEFRNEIRRETNMRDKTVQLHGQNLNEIYPKVEQTAETVRKFRTEIAATTTQINKLNTVVSECKTSYDGLKNCTEEMVVHCRANAKVVEENAAVMHKVTCLELETKQNLGNIDKQLQGIADQIHTKPPIEDTYPELHQLPETIETLKRDLNTLSLHVNAVQGGIQALQTRWDNIETSSMAQLMMERLGPQLREDIAQVKGTIDRIASMENELVNLKAIVDRHTTIEQKCATLNAIVGGLQAEFRGVMATHSE